MALAPGLILAAFGGAKDIGTIVSTFDWSKCNVRSSHSEEYLHTDLAPSYGKLTSDSVKALDENLKIMIAGTLTTIGKLTDKSWKSVLGTMMQHPLLEPDSAEVARADKLIKASSSAFKFDGSPDAQIVREVKTWFTKLIADADVLQQTRIDIDTLAKIVAQSGATIDSFETFWAKHEQHEQTLVDIGVLRFPDFERPYFKLYHIKLTAWSDSSRILFLQDDKNGITGEFNSKIFRPRESIIRELTKGTREEALRRAESLFD
ncbi:hypothetical protein MPTK1_8g05000 [Marchantia polymorpha subsp. ruderalis]|uniref:Uncharacterized protein n=1 Tax=Marchantia polymorpha TaxID=3197 RepID=A0A2R6WK78_MARPO|nr:hypothetical protein MARPO_0081s0001 [Marchantia polymorpha]BBN18732.1 hypothetical protein Mp_8g05000 [Marchantia polymorpha subsp. ruderalis]|eukprot:PTQ34270.1 hypothetical protein MARPO_0081s0001 [Marchantia polymorpha]